MNCLKSSIQRPGRGSFASSAGNRVSNRYGVAMPTPSIAEDRQRDHGRLSDRVAECGAHERRSARRGHDHRQHAGAEAAAPVGLADQCVRCPGVAEAAAECEFVDAEQVQPDDEEEHRQRRDDPRRLQLEAPAERAAGLLQGDQQAREQHEGQDYTDREGDAVHSHRTAVGAMLREPDQLQRQHRKHAGHQVQDQSADECGPEGGEQRHRRGRRRDRRGRTRGRRCNCTCDERRIDDRGPAARLRRAAVGDDHAGERLRIGLDGFRCGQGECEPIGAVEHLCRRGFDAALFQRVELELVGRAAGR